MAGDEDLDSVEDPLETKGELLLLLEPRRGAAGFAGPEAGIGGALRGFVENQPFTPIIETMWGRRPVVAVPPSSRGVTR